MLIFGLSLAAGALAGQILQQISTKGKEMGASGLRPVSKEATDKDYYWYECAPVGKENTKKFMEAMCQEVGITEK